MGDTAQDAPVRPQKPKRFGKDALGAEVFSVTPTARLYKAHALSAGAYGAVLLALADSVFLSVDPNDARWRVMLGLLLTMAPFAFIAQFLGPLIERLPGGNRFVLISAFFLRAVIALLMASQVDSLLFFPMTFGFLIADRTYNIAKSALVPGLVDDKAQLVKVNSRLQIIGSAAASGFLPIAFLLVFMGKFLNQLGFAVDEGLGGAPWGLAYAGVLFFVGGVLALQIPDRQREEADEAAKEEEAEAAADEKAFDPATAASRGGILLSSSAMAYVRAVVGFVTMLISFDVRGGIDPGPQGPGVELGHRIREALGEERLDLAVGGAPTWHFGAVAAGSAIGVASGSFLSPRLREQFSEDRNLAGMLGLIAIVGLVAGVIGGLAGSVAMGAAVGFGGAVGKQSFDAIVQRDTPQRKLGLAFAKFESRFQLVWVLGALIPVVLPLPARIGYLMVAGTAGFAAVSYWLGKDPAPNTEVARRTAAASAAKASRSVRDKTGAKMPVRRRKSSAPPPVVDEPTQEQERVTGFDETNTLPVHKPALTDTQPVPVIKIKGEED